MNFISFSDSNSWINKMIGYYQCCRRRPKYSKKWKFSHWSEKALNVGIPKPYSIGYRYGAANDQIHLMDIADFTF